VVVMTSAPARASSCARETQCKAGMDVAVDCEAPSTFYRVEEGEKFFNASISRKREEGVAPISEGERACVVALGSRAEG
jgi:hypothetical protein